MKPVMFKNRVNGERFVCENIRAVEQIDGVEYLTVHRLGEHREFKMRRDALERVNTPVAHLDQSATLRTYRWWVRILPGVPMVLVAQW